MRRHAHSSGLETWHFDFDSDIVLAATTTRNGGSSEGPYASLNLGFHVGDDPALVADNRARVCEALAITSLTVADQQHSGEVVVVDAGLAGVGNASLEESESRLRCVDALVTDITGVVLTVMVADCAPVVLYDPMHRAIGVAHCGRNGVVLDIIGATVAAMSDAFGSEPSDLRAGIGPCIGSTQYEIGGAAHAATYAAFGGDLLKPTRPGHALFDLLGAVRWRLDEAGVDSEHIEAAGVDTSSANVDLFSDRAERPCGRFMLVASLRGEA